MLSNLARQSWDHFIYVVVFVTDLDSLGSVGHATDFLSPVKPRNIAIECCAERQGLGNAVGHLVDGYTGRDPGSVKDGIP